jgi:hypothetical protein
VSFEILLITTIVFSMAIWVNSHYLSIKDSTLALQLTKLHAVKQIEGRDSQHTIESMDFQETSPTEIIIRIDITGALDCAAFDAAGLKSLIAENTKYEPTGIALELNGNIC